MIPNALWKHISAIIGSYSGGEPLSVFLKKYFKRFQELGSRDRKLLTEMAFSYYRFSKTIEGDRQFKNIIETCLSLNATSSLKLEENPSTARFEQVFPFSVPLSEGLIRLDWIDSLMRQPDLFIRVRKDLENIKVTLRSENIVFDTISETCLALPNKTKVEQLLPADCYVIQDASSQKTGEYFFPEEKEEWLDVCCGAGGKSLMLKDKQPDIILTATDKRKSIIENLKTRFGNYGHSYPNTFVVDATKMNELTKAFGNKLFDNIICDIPCSGSGTFARTPEQSYFFDPNCLKTYSTTQKQIALNSSKLLKSGGNLFYITCSVFRAENEEVVDFIQSNTGLRLMHSQLINGIEKRADCLFVAEFCKG